MDALIRLSQTFDASDPSLDERISRACQATIEWLNMLGHQWPMSYLVDIRAAAIEIATFARRSGSTASYLLASEVARRTERVIGQVANKKIADGVWRKKGATIAKSKSVADQKTFADYLSSNAARTYCYLWASVSDDEFEEALIKSLERGNLGMDTVELALKGQLPADRARNPASNRILTEMLGQLEGVAAGLTMANPQDVSPEVATEFTSGVAEIFRDINRFIKEMNLVHAN